MRDIAGCLDGVACHTFIEHHWRSFVSYIVGLACSKSCNRTAAELLLCSGTTPNSKIQNGGLRANKFIRYSMRGW